MTSQTQICNMALGAAAARCTITSINEDSNEANYCQLYYDSARQEALRAVNWNFAAAQIKLTLLGCAKNHTSQIPWNYKYAYPSDCVRAKWIMDVCNNNINLDLLNPYIRPNPPIAYVVGADKDALGNDIKVILTNMEHAVLAYTRNIANVSMFDDEFVLAFTHLLSSYIIKPLSGSTELSKSEYNMFMQSLLSARVSDGNEGLTVQDHIPDWIRARGYAGDWLYPGVYNDYPQIIGI